MRFLSVPGIDALYSGDAMMNASLPWSRARNAAAPAGIPFAASRSPSYEGPSKSFIAARSTVAPLCSAIRAARAASFRLNESARSDAAKTSTRSFGVSGIVVISLPLTELEFGVASQAPRCADVDQNRRDFIGGNLALAPLRASAGPRDVGYGYDADQAPVSVQDGQTPYLMLPHALLRRDDVVLRQTELQFSGHRERDRKLAGRAIWSMVAMQMSLSVTMATALPASSSTGRAPQSQSHMIRAAVDAFSPT